METISTKHLFDLIAEQALKKALFIVFFGCISTVIFPQKPPDYQSPLKDGGKPKPEKPVKGPRTIGYQGLIEAGSVAKNLDFSSVDFGGAFTAHGIYLNNIFLGLGAGIDRYDTLFVVPAVLDARFIFTGKNPTTLTSPPRKADLFLFFSGGYSNVIAPEEEKNKAGIVFQSGLGILIGRLKDVRMTITFGYKLQQLRNKLNIYPSTNIESFNLRIGAEFKG